MRRYHAGTDFLRAHSIAELAHMARQCLPHFASEYLEGGAEEELTLARIRQAGAGHALDLLTHELRVALTLLGQTDLNLLRASRKPDATFTVS